MYSSVPSSPSVSSFAPSASTAPSTPSELQSLQARHAGPVLSSSRSAYERWRPLYHLQPCQGWLNDPCAPFYNRQKKSYHVFFQWNSHSPDWGDICWGSATSPDLVHWDVQAEPSLEPGDANDRGGIFTGCHIPMPSSEENGVLTVAYTSVNQLPIHYTFPHALGSESLGLAYSFDNGKTWQKHANNPIISHEPSGLDVTGFRDPFVAPWRAMAELLGLEHEDTVFGIISGGIRNVTPTTFLYAIDRHDLSAWKYVGPLLNVGLNTKSSRWSGDLGKNWEVVNFITLTDQEHSKTQRDFLIMGTEGCLPSADASVTSNALTRPDRCQLWISGSISRSQTSLVTMIPTAIGHLDHGCFYAANSFYDPESNRQIVWGWVTEDDLCDELRHKQGWSGLLSLPRELRVQTLEHVVRARATALWDITSIEVEGDESMNNRETWTVKTVASEPVPSVVKILRTSVGARSWYLPRSPLGRRSSSSFVGFSSEQMHTSTWELSCSIRVSQSARTVGFTLVHSLDDSNHTILAFSPCNETISIDRPSFSGPGSNELINSQPEKAPHTLFTIRDPHTGSETEETLDIHVWRDNSVLEVFVNDRTAITTRIYAAEATYGLQFSAEDVDGMNKSELVYATLWDGIGL